MTSLQMYWELAGMIWTEVAYAIIFSKRKLLNTNKEQTLEPEMMLFLQILKIWSIIIAYMQMKAVTLLQWML